MSHRVLIVDDSLTVRMDLHDAFTADGFATVLCSTGAEARAAFAGDGFDAAVLDVLLPDADGLELLTELRKLPARSGVVTVLLSTEDEVADRLAGLRTGADEYVGKPYDAGYVVGRVRQLLTESPVPADDRPANLPAATLDRTEDSPSNRPTATLDRTEDSITVLIIDDSMTFREQLRDLLESEGYAVLTAPSGEEGLRLAADRRPQAIIVDGVMPGIDGATVIRRVRLDPALRDTPCILMTAADDYATELQMLDAGADAFLRKQQNLAIVPAKLNAVLRQSSEQLPIEVTGSLHGPSKVLALTPDRATLSELAESLRADGYDVVPVAGTGEALDLLAEQPVDCIVLGLGLDGDLGRDACRRIKDVPVIGETPVVMTGENDDDMLACLAAGADDYVRSGAGSEALRAHVRTQIRRKQSHDESRRIREELMRRELDAAEERSARQLAETRAALVEELEWRNRELEAFSGSVSHDLRGPLQVISSFAEHMLDDEGDPLSPESRRRLGRIQAAANRMADLVESLLILARASRGQLRRSEFDLSAMAWQVVGEIQARDPDRKTIFHVREGMSADGDEGLVRVVLENLVNNAVKFSGKVASPTVEIGADGDRFFVRDNGAGFPAGQAGELFRPFARLHSADEFPGTGIGLTTVHRAVERHGGEIWAEGENGQGATFWFTLPPAPPSSTGERRGQARRAG